MNATLKRIQTPRGNFKVEKIFETEQAARAAGYEHYFGYINETENVYVHVYTFRSNLEHPHHVYFGFVLEKR